MKDLLSLFLVLVLIITLTSCKDKSNSEHGVSNAYALRNYLRFGAKVEQMPIL